MLKLLFLLLPIYLLSSEFRLATYNIENLFDLKFDGNEYKDYVPNSKYGWNRESFSKKLRNISKVICDLNPDIIALQEVENFTALLYLQKSLKVCGSIFEYKAIADYKDSTVKCALLSKLPIVSKKEIEINKKGLRNILEVDIDVYGYKLTLFINHWKSRRGPESLRVISAKALIRRVKQINNEYIILGDLNSDWNEWESIRKSKRRNDTDGFTAIGDVLKTKKDSFVVEKESLKEPYHLNLWTELPKYKRWSYNFYGKKSALDHIILPPSMFDKTGIDYINGSFRVFKPFYLFSMNGSIKRWKMGDTSSGYSDHLPIYADFTVTPLILKDINNRDIVHKKSKKNKEVDIDELYELNPGEYNLVLKDATVIYKKGDFAILKKPNSRAIAVYKDIKNLKIGYAYDLLVKQIYNYKGLQEITEVEVLKKIRKENIDNLLLKSTEGLKSINRVNEVLKEIGGIYKRGFLYYDKGKKIKLYFKDSALKPVNGQKILLKHIRVGIYNSNIELVVD